MILTGPKLREEIESGGISLDPYKPELVGTNSIDMLLHSTIRLYPYGALMHRKWTNWYGSVHEKNLNWGDSIPPTPTLGRVAMRDPIPVLDMKEENPTEEVRIPEEGMIMWPGILYLARTVETIGSKKYVPWFDGRSSVGRLGIHVHVTAGRGDTGWFGTVTLEMHVVEPIRVYADTKPICQASFFETLGDLEEYQGRYQGQVDPTPSRFHQDKHDRLKA